MKRFCSIILFAAFILSSCRPDALYETEDVSLSLELKRVSAGFVEAAFSTDKDAYYFVDIEPVWEGVDPMKIESQFKSLALDHAYVEYVNWRYSHLYKGEEHIAEFSSHSLQYGAIDKYFTGLEPDSDYWVFGFVVDPETNKPCGDLILRQIHTAATTTIKTTFDYRVNDVWDYVYPKDDKGELCFYIPWVGETVDSLKLKELGVKAPGYYFIGRMLALQGTDSPNIFYGMYAHKNDGVGDGTSTTRFEQGHTYYTALASFDGPLVLEGAMRNYSIFKFTWTPGLQRKFGPEDDTLGAW